MGRKKFGWKDALSLGIQAAGVVGNVASAQAGVDKAAAKAAAGKAGGEAGKAANQLGNKNNTYKISEAAKPKVDTEAFKGSFADQRPAAEGGVSKATTKTLRDAQQNTGQSALVKAYKSTT